MRRAARAGVPVPRVHDVSGPEIRMDRVGGPTMAGYLAEHPERSEFCGRVVADLDRTLDGTQSGGGALVHGDLHPGNVVMSKQGSVLIDWTNHQTGPRALDVALTWLVLDCFDPDEHALTLELAPLRARLLRSFSDAVDVVAAAAALLERHPPRRPRHDPCRARPRRPLRRRVRRELRCQVTRWAPPGGHGCPCVIHDDTAVGKR